MFEYFCCVLGGTVVAISAARARFAAGSPSYTSSDQSVPGGSPISPDSCDSSRRIVTVSIAPNGLPAARSSGRCATTGSSKCRRPSSRSCMIAVAVKVLVIEAIR